MRPGVTGLPTASLRLIRRLIAGSESDRRADDETAKCPESLRPILALPPLGRRNTPPQKTLLLRPRSYGLMRRSHLALPHFSNCLVREVFAGCYQPLLPPGSSRRYLCESFLGCLVPCHGGPTECMYLFLPPCHRPSPTGVWVGLPASTREHDFPRSVFSRLQTFLNVQASEFAHLPDRSYPCAYCRRAAEAFTSEQNMLRYLRMHRIC